MHRAALRPALASWIRASVLPCLCAILLGGCALPALKDRPPSTALPQEQARTTPLGRGVAAQVAAHPGESGIHPLANAHDAFAARMLLARAAARTLDVQYYIWRGDLTGTLLLEALHAAAERGVRVRLLLDDNGTDGLDPVLAALDTHPNIEVRLFNPFPLRKPKMLGYLTDFSRLNRRMHNKSFTADNQATIIGGRNIGDEYFGATNDVLFADLDVLAIGSAVDEVSGEFDRYWASASAYPARQLLPPVNAAQLEDLAAQASLLEHDPAAAAYMRALREVPFIQALVQGELPLEWAPTRMVSDDPAKVLDKAAPETLLPHQLKDIIGQPQQHLELVSPYFVPTAAGVEAFGALARQGVRVRILTNALEATDVAVVHAGYAKRRKDLLRAGVELYEMRRAAGTGGGRGASATDGRQPGKSSAGSSGSSLHAKTFAVDNERVFVGSFNFDPRSARLNTELGFVIDSPVLAGRLATLFDTAIPAETYAVRLNDSGKLQWTEQTDGQTVRHDTEPGTTLWQRLAVWFLSLLPIEPLL